MNNRPYAGPADCEKMMLLSTGIAGIDARLPYYHIGDICWQLNRFAFVDPRRDVRLWEDTDGTLLGYIWYHRQNSLDFEIHPDQNSAQIIKEMMAWGAERRQQGIARADEGATGPLLTSAYEDDQQNIAAIMEQGFVFDCPFVIYNMCSLAREIVDFPAPEGFTIRNVDPEYEHEIERRVEAHQAAFNSKRVSVESYKNLMSSLGYRPELDVIAVAPDGKIASYCNGWIDPVSMSGYVEPMGTPPAFQRKGLGKAVLTEALRRFQSMGCLTAAVVSEVGNPSSNALYRSVGFEPYKVVHRYRKDINE